MARMLGLVLPSLVWSFAALQVCPAVAETLARVGAQDMMRRAAAGPDTSREISSSGAVQNPHAADPRPQTISQVLVLTNSGRRGMSEKLLAELRKLLSLPVVKVEGLNAQDFATEADLESQSRLPMSEKEKQDWHRLASPSATAVADPALACSIGHKEMWKLAANASAWTVILEDDAAPFANFSQKHLQMQMEKVALAGADLVFMDDKHCQSYSTGLLRGPGVQVHGGISSAAYAVTPHCAQLLLRAPFLLHPDRLLNKLAHDGQVAAYCPTMPTFSVRYRHESQIGDTLSRADGQV